MASLLHQARYWYGAAALAGVALVWYWPSGDQPAVTPTNTASGAAALLDGMLKSAPHDSGARQSMELSPDDALAPEGLSVDASGQLRPDRPLRMVFEFFLVRGEGLDLDARAAQLRGHLERQVRGPALEQAKTLAGQYLAYVRAYDEQLSSQHIALQPGALPSMQQLEQLAIWQQQRLRLRHSSFTTALADLWFADDDAALANAIADLRERGEASANATAPDQEPDSNTLRARRLHNPAQDAARDTELAELFTQATTTYQDAAAGERQWRERFLTYRNAAARLQAPDAAQRQQQLSALQQQIFPTERERIRARASGIE
jgi:lipase chaperone LimK